MSRKVYYVLVDPGIDSLYISVYNNGMIHQVMATRREREADNLITILPSHFVMMFTKRRKNFVFSFLIDYVRSLKSSLTRFSSIETIQLSSITVQQGIIRLFLEIIGVVFDLKQKEGRRRRINENNFLERGGGFVYFSEPLSSTIRRWLLNKTN